MIISWLKTSKHGDVVAYRSGIETVISYSDPQFLNKIKQAINEHT